MKKKHRRAVYKIIMLIPAAIGFIGYYISEIVDVHELAQNQNES